MNKKDIFIDNNVAKNFASAKDVEYLKLIFWLLQYSKDEIDKYFVKIPQKIREQIYTNKPIRHIKTN